MAPRPWNQARRLPAWRDTRGYEFISTGRLELRIFGPLTAYDGDRYRDAKTVRLEDRLPDLFRSLDIYRLKREANARAREREDDERQRRWELAMEEARAEFGESVRRAELLRQASAWRRATELREYGVALRRAIVNAGEDERARVEEWISLAESEALLIDPLEDLPGLVPVVPVPSAEDLKPFLRGWSPYRPERR